ncbi:hypothetical protein B0H12DRAFT_1113666 [Mycena haematopus]|nr:hypothetical protein B0H12DRAFT_1113666 [Mycena haematopus]
MPCCDSNMDMFDIEEDVFSFESAEERQARELRTMQNELISIARLPPEILADIFVRCVPTSVHALHSDLSWLNVARVSSKWRNVALSCPDFWGTLIFSRPKWTPIMLARSKMASLVVRVDLQKDHANSPEPILLENASRLGILDIYSPQSELTTFLANLEHADCAPCLQQIKVVNADADSWAEGMWLPKNLFRRMEVVQNRKVGKQPAVRLHLEGCAFPWDSWWYFHLTYLHLENIVMHRPPMETLLAILAGSPDLQTLTLIYCCPIIGQPSIVELPRLTSLNITDDPSSLCLLLSCLIVPPSAVINTSSAVYSNYDPEFMKALNKTIYQDLIPVFSEDLAPDTYDTVRIGYRSGFTYSLHHSARPEWSRSLRIDAATWVHDHALRVTESVRDYLDFSNITTLHLDGMPLMPFPWATTHDQAFHSTLSLWDTMGRNLRHVHTLHLRTSFPDAWLEFMLTQAMLLIGVSHYRSCFNVPIVQRGLPFRGPDGALTHAWPALRCLALHDIDLAIVLDHRPTCGDMLRALLWARREGKAPIWKLEMEGCTDVTRHLVHLRLFTDVVYDGKWQNKRRYTDEEDEFARAYSIGVFAESVLDVC